MLKRWRWFRLLGEPSAGALTVGRAAGQRGGSQGSASPRHEGGIAFTAKHQPRHLAMGRAISGRDVHSSHKEKKSHLPASPTSGGKGVSPRKDG